ncbi:MAG: methyltransferase domain-containing protein [Saprospiraceae bacterium]
MKKFLKQRISKRTFENLRAIAYDFKRFKTRMFQKKKNGKPLSKNLQLGSGVRQIPGWVNVDLSDADVNLDLTYGLLPWPDASFDNIVSQHVIEHLILEDELISMLTEAQRILTSGGQLWLATPDMRKICQSYLDNNCEVMYEDRVRRMPGWTLNGLPTQHMMNDFFHQQGEHKNLFDFELLKWVLQKSGFKNIQKTSELNLLDRFPGFPERGDDVQALYVLAIKD